MKNYLLIIMILYSMCFGQKYAAVSRLDTLLFKWKAATENENISSYRFSFTDSLTYAKSSKVIYYWDRTPTVYSYKYVVTLTSGHYIVRLAATNIIGTTIDSPPVYIYIKESLPNVPAELIVIGIPK